MIIAIIGVIHLRWQMETVPSGDDPRTFKLDFRFNLLPGVNSVKHYSVYLVRNIWPESIVGHVYEMLDEMSKNKASVSTCSCLARPLNFLFFFF